jgi:phosphonate transport system ATP-binding protein
VEIRTKHLCARHPAARTGAPDALREATIHIRHGEQVAVIGPSGAGKTTLLNAIACSLVPTQGAISLDAENPWQLARHDLQKLRGRLYVAPQTPPLPPRQRVITAVLAGSLPTMTFWQSIASLIYPKNIAGAHDALTKFDLSSKLFDRVDRLSGGERQRVGLARALLSPATLWLIDEPLSALDPTRAKQAMDSLVNEAVTRKITLVVTLHQVEVALARFPRVIGLRDGVVAFDLPASEVSQEKLHALYAQHEDELTGPAPMNDDIAVGVETTPTLMHCR